MRALRQWALAIATQALKEQKMSKAEFIANVANSGDMSNAEAKRVVELVFGEIEAGLKRAKKDGKFTIGTFGTFTVSKRAARKGRKSAHRRRNQKLKRRNRFGFRPSSSLKDAAGC